MGLLADVEVYQAPAERPSGLIKLPNESDHALANQTEALAQVLARAGSLAAGTH
jgi:hypothetical protein